MANHTAPYVTLDVFTDRRFKGNQVAIVELADALSSENMQMIAREFNFSETVFIRRPGPSERPQINIFTPVNEMDFAGHPVIGTGHALFQQLLPCSRDPAGQRPESLEIQTKAGIVTVKYDAAAQTVSAQVPHNVHVHSAAAPLERIVKTQPGLAGTQIKAEMSVTSIVKGVTYVLVDLTDHSDVFASLEPGPSPEIPLDDAWTPSFVGTMYYKIMNTRSVEGKFIWDLRVRMIAINLEDPACGSGSCSLGAYLALQHGQASGSYRFYLDQGSEIGRDSNIIVDIELNEQGNGVKSVLLSGRAALVTEGKMLLP